LNRLTQVRLRNEGHIRVALGRFQIGEDLEERET
jgi:hypothetical protein